MAFKMRSNPMQRNFGSALKHYRGKDGKVLDVHGHKSEGGDTTYHGKNRSTGKPKTYNLKDGKLVENEISSFGQNKFDE